MATIASRWPDLVQRRSVVRDARQQRIEATLEARSEVDGRHLRIGGSQVVVRLLFEPQPEAGAVPSPFNLTSALYHVCGTAPFTFECPHGLVDERACQVTWEAILDIQLALYEAILRWALAAKAAGK